MRNALPVIEQPHSLTFLTPKKEIKKKKIIPCIFMTKCNISHGSGARMFIYQTALGRIK